MTDARPLIIGSNDTERAVLQRAFGASDALVVAEGASVIGYRASAIFITASVNRSTEWFQTSVLSRLLPGGEVFTIRPEWHSRFMG